MNNSTLLQFESLAKEYSKKYGSQSAGEVTGTLMFSVGLDQTVKTLLKAKGREILVNHPKGIIDGLVIRYK